MYKWFCCVCCEGGGFVAKTKKNIGGGGGGRAGKDNVTEHDKILVFQTRTDGCL